MIEYKVTSEMKHGAIKTREFQTKLQKDVETFKHQVRMVNVGGVNIDATIVINKDGVLKQLHLERSKSR